MGRRMPEVLRDWVPVVVSAIEDLANEAMVRALDDGDVDTVTEVEGLATHALNLLAPQVEKDEDMAVVLEIRDEIIRTSARMRRGHGKRPKLTLNPGGDSLWDERCQELHARARRSEEDFRRTFKVIGEIGDDVERYILGNCPRCHTTLSYLVWSSEEPS